MKDFYDILGLDENAGESLIKSSYRKLASIYHPDKNPENQDKFIDINEAYKTLSNEALRNAYDKELKDFKSFKASQSENKVKPYRTRLRDGANVNLILDFTSDIEQKFQENKNIKEDLEKQEYFIDKIIEAERYIKCPSCNGEGKEKGTLSMPCPECRGTGNIKNKSSGVMEICRNCDGYGDIFLYKCKTCKGMARIKTSEKIKLNFSLKELLNGGDKNIIIFEGMGDAGAFGGKNGNLNVTVKIDEIILNKINKNGGSFLSKFSFFKLKQKQNIT